MPHPARLIPILAALSSVSVLSSLAAPMARPAIAAPVGAVAGTDQAGVAKPGTEAARGRAHPGDPGRPASARPQPVQPEVAQPESGPPESSPPEDVHVEFVQVELVPAEVKPAGRRLDEPAPDDLARSDGMVPDPASAQAVLSGLRQSQPPQAEPGPPRDVPAQAAHPDPSLSAPSVAVPPVADPTPLSAPRASRSADPEAQAPATRPLVATPAAAPPSAASPSGPLPSTPLSSAPLPTGLARAGLLPGWTGASGARILALDLQLEPGWKTYWRSPGDSGLPPQLDWSGSENLSHVTLHWPAPEPIRSGTALELGYHDRLVLPLTAWPRDPSRPVEIRLEADLGLCRDICVPANLSLAAPPPGPDPDPAILRALATVPRPLPDRPACEITPIADGMRVAMTLSGPAPTLAAIEIEPGEGIWVSGAEILAGPQGPRAVVEMVGPSNAPFALDRDSLRLTVLPADGTRATETRGCAPG